MTLSIHSPDELVAVIPHLLGFKPDHLGHTSKTVTERHYINRRLVVPDYRAATERLAPGPGTGDGPALGL